MLAFLQELKTACVGISLHSPPPQLTALMSRLIKKTSLADDKLEFGIPLLVQKRNHYSILASSLQQVYSVTILSMFIPCKCFFLTVLNILGKVYPPLCTKSTIGSAIRAVRSIVNANHMFLQYSKTINVSF